MTERNKTLNEAQRNLANLLNRIYEESLAFKKLFVGLHYQLDAGGNPVLDDKGMPVEAPFRYDPSCLDPADIKEFLKDFPRIEPMIKFLLSNTGLGGTDRKRMLRKLRALRRVRARPDWLVTDSTRELVRYLLANLAIAIDGAISASAATRDRSTVDLSNQMVQNISLQDVTHSSLDTQPDEGPTPRKKLPDGGEYVKW